MYEKYEIRLTANQPIRIGGKDEPLGNIDNPIAKVGERMCIPGPSLKGAYRNELERWLNETYARDGTWQDESRMPCLPSTQPSKSEELLYNNKKYRKEVCKCDEKEKTPPDICPVCYLLGAPGLTGFVNIPFLFAPKEKQPSALYATRMDRATNTVKSGNRSYQLVVPGTTFSGDMEVLIEDKFVNWEIGKPRKLHNGVTADKWLENECFANMSREKFIETFIIKRLEAIKVIGGFRSKGFGSVSIAVTKK